MLKAMKWSATALLVLFVGAQFVRPARTNPVFDEAKAIHSLVEIAPEVSAILTRACYGCHSNKTEWPWYSKVAPMSWLVISHVNDGRRHLNFSEWENYDRSKAVKKMQEIDEEVRIKAMPLSSYTLLHPEARLSDQERTLISDWARAESKRLESATAVARP
ncbi:MAG: heme-binding domain-containing protein [Blastocatellia bacterium]